MKKIYLIALLTISLSSCATLEKQTANYDSCVNDPECVLKMQQISTATGGVASIVGNAVASPISIPITAAVILLSTLLAGVYYGGKIKKPKVL